MSFNKFLVNSINFQLRFR